MPGKSAIIELNAASFAAIFKRRMLYCSMAINPFMRAALKALSYPEILDKKNGYRLQRAAVNASHPHVLRPFYKIWDHHILASDHEVPVRVFSPEVEGVFPMLLFFHGGGWVTGNIDSYDKVCTNMARLTPPHCGVGGLPPGPRAPLPRRARGLLSGRAGNFLPVPPVRHHARGHHPDRRQRGRKPGGGGLADGAGPRGIHAPPADFAVPGHQQRPHRKFPPSSRCAQTAPTTF